MVEREADGGERSRWWRKKQMVEREVDGGEGSIW